MNKAEKEKIIWQVVMEEMAIHEFQGWLHSKIGLSDEYTDSRINASVCCPSCFEPIQVNLSQCPRCHSVLDISVMGVLRDNAFELATYAWNHRNIYEKDVSKGKVYRGEVARKYHLMPPEGWLVYLASIVFAAILGGLSYDGFKKLISKVRDIFRNRFKKEVPEEKWLHEFYDKLLEYFSGKRNAGSPILRAYVEGLIRGSTLRAEFEHSPNFETDLMNTVENIMTTLDSGVSKVEIPDLFPREPLPEDEIKKQLQELLEKHTESEQALKKLQKYLADLRKKNV